MSNRFGFYGVLGGITLALLVSKLMGCASPASAEPPSVQNVTTASHTAPIVDPDLGIISLLELPPGEYIADTSDVYVDGETTITIEDTHITIY